MGKVCADVFVHLARHTPGLLSVALEALDSPEGRRRRANILCFIQNVPDAGERLEDRRVDAIKGLAIELVGTEGAAPMQFWSAIRAERVADALEHRTEGRDALVLVDLFQTEVHGSSMGPTLRACTR